MTRIQISIFRQCVINIKNHWQVWIDKKDFIDVYNRISINVCSPHLSLDLHFFGISWAGATLRYHWIVGFTSFQKIYGWSVGFFLNIGLLCWICFLLLLKYIVEVLDLLRYMVVVLDLFFVVVEIYWWSVGNAFFTHDWLEFLHSWLVFCSNIWLKCWNWFPVNLAFHVVRVGWAVDIPSKEDVTRFSPELSFAFGGSLYHHWDTEG